jgi:hypothetical protein
MAFGIAARVDLRVGALACGLIRPRGDLVESFNYSNLTRLLRGARMAWRERGLYSSMALAVPAAMTADLDPDLVSEAAVEAGHTHALFGFELDETALASSLGVAEALRARGWALALRGAPACPLPLGGRVRNLFGEVTHEAPACDDLRLGLEGDRSALGRRILAAQAAGITLTAESVQTQAQARQLAIAGFHRAGGAYAESKLR